MKKQLAVLALCALCLAGCAGQSAPEPVQSPGEPEKEPFVYTPPAPKQDAPHFEGITETVCGELVLQMPFEYAELVITEKLPEAWNEHWTPLFSISERESLQAFETDHPDEDWAMGWLCTVSRLDRIGFEEFVSGDSSGAKLFARDGDERYYIISKPTDVRLYRGESGIDEAALAQWKKLTAWVDTLAESIVARNSLTSYDAHELFGASHTYGGEHIELGCSFPGQPMDLVVLSLSQPEKQGENGIWCVERVYYVYSEYDWTETHLVFPAALGFDETASEHYARLQAECDAGKHPELLTPRGAALDYAKRVSWLFGEDVSETDFTVVEALG
ncbi:MAG: hypothetical protein J5449_02380 [Oscillospiraceae bacterium]|nr:hypothetical protein [Oscillospiraceae bacterium]